MGVKKGIALMKEQSVYNILLECAVQAVQKDRRHWVRHDLTGAKVVDVEPPIEEMEAMADRWGNLTWYWDHESNPAYLHNRYFGTEDLSTWYSIFGTRT